MKKMITTGMLLLLIFMTTYAQNFSVLGERSLDLDWDFPVAEHTYSDTDGNIYVYLNESNSPRTSELIKYDITTNLWEDLTDNTFIVPGGVSTTDGVGQPDGSILTVSNSFDENHYAFNLSVGGTFTAIGDLPSSNANNLQVTAAQAPNGDFYYAHALFNLGVQKFDGTNWVALPTVENTAINGGRHDLEIDDQGIPYVAYGLASDGHSLVAFFDGTNWVNIYDSAGTEVQALRPNIVAVSPTEVYLAITVGNTSNTTGVKILIYDGTEFTQLGNTIITGDVTAGFDILKATNGDLFLVTTTESGTGNGFYRFDTAENDWALIENDISDGGEIAGFQPRLLEARESIYITFTEFGAGSSGLTTVRFNESVLGVTDIDNTLDVAIFPNPANDKITVKSASEIGNISIYSISGEKITEANSTNEVDISSFSSGMYLVNITSETGTTTKKLIKQ